MAKTKINSLDDLLEEKARVHAQLEIVKKELHSSAEHTRARLGAFLDDKLSIPRQIGQLFRGGGGPEAAGASAIGAIGRVAGLSPWWSGILATVAPVAVNLAKNQLRKRRERKRAKAAETPGEAAETDSPAPVQKRGLFRRKSKDTPTAD